MTANEMLTSHAALVEAALENHLPAGGAQKILVEAMRYALLGGGKRVRPALVLEFYRHFTGETAPALPFACAVEMVHCYSLVHDDLPCMDDDDLRRGRPSCHRRFGEATALLAGDALLSLAFETALKTDTAKIAPERVIRCARLLAFASGAQGMAGGQIIDLQSENRRIPEPLLEELHGKKTGAMIRAAAVTGAVLGGADEAQADAADAYAAALGLQFQIIDDILNVTSSPEILGKPTGSDADSGKTTYVTLYGVDGARKKAGALSAAAKQSLVPLGSPDTLIGLADLLCARIR